MTQIAIVVHSLGVSAASDEDTVQILLFSAQLVSGKSTAKSGGEPGLTILTIDSDHSGWGRLSKLLPKKMLDRVSIETVPEAETPNLSIGEHKHAYNLFEFLKRKSFDEVHCTDRYGRAYYLTMARKLGLHLIDTMIGIHVTGSTLYRIETMDQLLQDQLDLMNDVMEIGAVERADVVFVHDRKAWEWYVSKATDPISAKVVDLSIHAANAAEQVISKSSGKSASHMKKVVYSGNLGRDDGLHLFCDAINRLPLKIRKNTEIEFVGSESQVGSMDSITYIRIRTSKWEGKVTIKRGLTLQEEYDYLSAVEGVIVCNTTKREGLRARLAMGMGNPVIRVAKPQAFRKDQGDALPANPGLLAEAISKALKISFKPSTSIPAIADLWGRSRQFGFEAPERPAKLSIVNKSGPRVSVCVTHFSRVAKLKLALETLKAQTYQNFEVIVVDDGTSDRKMRSELTKLKKEIAPLGWRIVNQPNRYLGSARNHAAALASGEYLLFMDDDNAAKPNELSTMVAVALRTDADVVTSFYDSFVEDADLKREKPELRFAPFGGDLALAPFSPCFGDANSLFRRSFFDGIGGFSEDYGITHEDWELLVRAGLSGGRIVTVPEPLFWYRVDPEGMYRNQQMQLHTFANLRRHIRPYLEKLPHYQGKLVQFAQGLANTHRLTAAHRSKDDRALHGHLPESLRQLPFARVAIIVRTKDRPILLRRAIRSAIDQSFKDWLLVIVNDGGDPETVQLVVDEVEGELAGRVLVVNNPVSLGMQPASNAGITSCNSEFVIIHDDDDSWDPSFLSRTVAHMDAVGWNPKVGGVITWSRVIIETINDDQTISQQDEFILNHSLYTLSLYDLAVENKFPPISFLFSRACMDDVGLFQDRHGPLGDWDFHMRVLQDYDIDVIPEPLANYHHRKKGTEGVYGNSVHAQDHIHKAKRIELINGFAKEGFDKGNLSLAHMLLLGQVQTNIISDQQERLKKIGDYLWEIDQRVKYIADKTYQTTDGARPKKVTHRAPLPTFRNLAENGDFRVWHGASAIQKFAGLSSQFFCPGYLVTFDGAQPTHKVEQFKIGNNSVGLNRSKTALRIVNSGSNRLNAGWINLECIIPSVDVMQGQTITVSGICKMESEQDWLIIAGQYDLAKRETQKWDEHTIRVSEDLKPFWITFEAPQSSTILQDDDQFSRVIIRLPRSRRFVFEITNFQIELGDKPTNFIFHSPQDGPSSEVKPGLWEKIRMAFSSD